MVKGLPLGSCCKHFCTCCFIKIVCQNAKKYVKAMILTDYGLHLLHNHIYRMALALRYPPLNTHLVCTMRPLALANDSVNIANQKQQSLMPISAPPSNTLTARNNDKHFLCAHPNVLFHSFTCVDSQLALQLAAS